MTIAAGFMCHDGVVLCADTQETRHGLLKVKVAKLALRPEIDVPSISCKMVISGAGDGSFIDKLVDRMWTAAINNRPEMPVIQEAIEDTIKQAHEEYGRIFQPGYLPEAHLLYALWVRGWSVRLYSSVGPVVNQVESHECVGIGDVLARYLTDQMFISTMKTAQAELLSIYMLYRTKEYIESCGGDSHIVALHNNGTVHIVDRMNLALLEPDLRRISSNFGSILLRAPSPECSDEEFEETLRMFGTLLRTLRQEQQRFRDGLRQSDSQTSEREQ